MANFSYVGVVLGGYERAKNSKPKKRCDGESIYCYLASCPISKMISKQSKRRKIAGDTLPQGIACPIYNLIPEGILKEVAKFLEAPSRVLLAIAIEPPSSPYDIILARCQPKLTRSPITCNNDWHTLDFGDIEKELSAKYCCMSTLHTKSRDCV
eukprot:scaffold21760_cov56-Skeletonema_menzelii.AAC.1